MPRFFEFFAGGGMVRSGLGRRWRCAFANDVDPEKAAIYRRNWGESGLVEADVRDLAPAQLPGRADLAWASFPCQDLSLAGAGGGLSARRSGTFWPFWDLMRALVEEGRGPRVIALENVCGALTSHGGRDFSALIDAVAGAGYRVGALVIDAALFVPQSRPRLFIIAATPELDPSPLTAAEPDPLWTPETLGRAAGALPEAARAAWVWWTLPRPPLRNTALGDLLEPDRPPVRWRTPAQTARLLELMAPLHRERIEGLRARSLGDGGRRYGAAFRRTRRGPEGGPAQRVEARFDGLAGCLRTPAGGSSRQILLEVHEAQLRSRLLTPRETARLMGLPDDYALPERATAAYHLTGDGVVAPVVRHLAARLIEPLLATAQTGRTTSVAAE